ncbi:MAG: hypothetical protein AABY49_07500, partial [Planctomycetota bacterium]
MTTCTIIVHDNNEFLQQIYTGFFCLHKKKLIKLEQKINRLEFMDVHKSFHLKDARNFHLKVILNHTVRLYYDMHDSWEVDEEALDQCDFYFKRSYNRKKIEHLKKVYPFGFNYEVYPNDMDLFALQRSLFLSTGWKERIIKSLHSLKIVDKYFCPPRLEYLESLPDYQADPKIIFVARLWDPNDDQERPEGKKENMVYVNKMRVECVRALRKEFQDKFYGGIAPTKFAIENFPDTIIPDFNNSRKRDYLKLYGYPLDCRNHYKLYGC